MAGIKWFQLYYTNFYPIDGTPGDARPVGMSFNARGLEEAARMVNFNYPATRQAKISREGNTIYFTIYNGDFTAFWALEQV